MSSPTVLAKTYPAIGEAVAIVRRDIAVIAAYLGAGDELVENLRLAVSEAATHVVESTFGAAVARMRVSLELLPGDALLLTVADDGAGAVASTGPVGGLGFVVMSSCAEEVNVRRSASGGTEIELRFTLDASGLDGREGGAPTADSTGRASADGGARETRLAFHAAAT